MPFFWSEKNKNKYKNLILNRKKILLFFSLIVISIFFYSDIEGFGLRGGGAIFKLSKIIEFNFLFLISAILGILLINYYYKNLSGLLTIILLFLSYPISILYQKYFDPIFILFFLILSGSKILQDNLGKRSGWDIHSVQRIALMWCKYPQDRGHKPTVVSRNYNGEYIIVLLTEFIDAC